MPTASYAVMDDALDLLSAYGPDLANGLTSHAPMAAEALCALGRRDAVIPWLERYRRGMLPRPTVRERIAGNDWRAALAQPDRFADWAAFFAEELRGASWGAVLNRWAARLAPGICASAAHGVIRVGHAARSLSQAETPLRLRELADALAYWAANYQELPTRRGTTDAGVPAGEAITKVAVVPPERRVFSGTIVSSLEALSDFPAFAPVIALLDVSGETPDRVADLAQVFARVYLANTHDILTAIVFIHGVTSVAALGSLLPHLDDATAREALRYTWQAGCGLYAAFGSHPAPTERIEPPRESADTLIDMAIAHGDEHAIKFTEACLRYDALDPSPAFVAAARNALDMLPRA
jgi:questin oxidase-like protein